MVESYLAEFPATQDRRRGLCRQGRLRLRDGTHRRHHQRGGPRLSTGGMEEVLSAHKDVAECAVLGIKDELKGEVPCGFIVLKAGVNRRRRDRAGVRAACPRQDRSGGIVPPRSCGSTPSRTRSGKILRGTIKKIADGDAWTMPATIEDPKVLDEIGGALKDKGVGV